MPTPSRRRRRAADLAAALDSLRRIVRAGRGATQAVQSRFGLSSAQLYVLQTLAESPGMSIKDLVKMTLTTNSTVSEVVGRLVDSGLVTREVAADDRRKKVLTLTESGREIVRHSPRTIQRQLIDGFNRLPARDQHSLSTTLDEWCRLSGLANVPPTMLFELSVTEESAPPAPAKRRATKPASRTH
jgi:DNA-binding MarR family transcriptional regulator